MTAPSSLSRARATLIAVIAVLSLIEFGLTLGDMMGLGGGRLRQLVYEYAGFWPGLLSGWEPNYPGQPWLMFASYALLHGGAVHLIVNMISLWSLGVNVATRVGAGGLWAIYGMSALGGAVAYGILANGVRPMVGASGALFGLAGALVAWAYIDRFTARAGLWPVVQVLALLLGMNLAMYWALDGQLAWQTHLGGFLAGWLMAVLIDPRPRALTPPSGEADPKI